MKKQLDEEDIRIIMKEKLMKKVPVLFESKGGIDINCWELYKQLKNNKTTHDSYRSWFNNKIFTYKLKYEKDYIFKFMKNDRYLQENEIDRLGIDWKSYKKNRRFTEKERQRLRAKRIKLIRFVSLNAAIQLSMISDTNTGKMIREYVSDMFIKDMNL